MNSPRALLVTLILSIAAIANSAHATLHTFDFTGTGINGTTAGGSFVVDDPEIVPNYGGGAEVFSAYSVTLQNIPAGTGTFTIGKPDAGASYVVGPTGTPYIQPTGNYPASGSAIYRLFSYDGDGVNTPFRSSLWYADNVNNTFTQVDLITWSPATEQEPAVPEPATYVAAMLAVLGLLVFHMRGRVRLHRLKLG